TVNLLDTPDFGGRPVERRFPRHGAEPGALDTRKGALETIRMLVLHIALHALGAELAAVEGEIFPGLEADHLVRLDLELDATLLAAEAAVRLDEPVYFTDRRPATGRSVARMRPE